MKWGACFLWLHISLCWEAQQSHLYLCGCARSCMTEVLPWKLPCFSLLICFTENKFLPHHHNKITHHKFKSFGLKQPTAAERQQFTAKCCCCQHHHHYCCYFKWLYLNSPALLLMGVGWALWAAQLFNLLYNLLSVGTGKHLAPRKNIHSLKIHFWLWWHYCTKSQKL